MDKVADKIAALGVPGLILVVAMSATGWTGAAALTTALAALGGPLGMLGGLAMLGVLGLIARALTDYGFEAVFKAVVVRLRKDGLSDAEIAERVEGYPVSRALKAKIHWHLGTLSSGPA